VIGPGAALEYRSILVPIAPDAPREEAVDFACRLAAERRAAIAAITVIEVPLHLPLDARLPEEEERANRVLDEARSIGELYGVNVVGRLVRARSPGRAIVDEAERRHAEIIVMGAPRERGRRRAIFGRTTDFVLKHAPCRVMVAAAKRAA
jgi:APA family basic amino acid/polyamine antiporter